MMDAPLITVVIPLYNAESYIGDAIRSVLAQTVGSIQLVVVDDGSTDGSAAIVRGFGSAVEYRHQPNSGVASARNAGLSTARGHYIAFLDADDVWLPHKLERQLELLGSDPSAVAVGCGLLVVDADLRIIEEQVGRSATFTDLLLMRSDGGITSGSRILTPTDLVREIGGFDSHLSTSADWDLALRILGVGPIVAVPEPLVLYRKHAGNMHRSIEVMEADMTLLLAKAYRSSGLMTARLYRRARARLFHVLAASYWQTRRPLSAVRCLLRAVYFWPGQLAPAFWQVGRAGVRFLRTRLPGTRPEIS